MLNWKTKTMLSLGMTLYIVAFQSMKATDSDLFSQYLNLAILKQLKNRLRALVYCQRDRPPNIAKELKKQSITVLDVEKDFASSRKHKDQVFCNVSAYYTIVLCLNWNIDILCSAMTVILKKNCSKRLSERAWKALENGSSVVAQE